MCNLGQKTKENFAWALPVISTACMACELHFHVYRMKSFLLMQVKRNTGENSGISFCSQACSIQNVVQWDNELPSTPIPELYKSQRIWAPFGSGAFTSINSCLVWFTMASCHGLALRDQGWFIAWAAASLCSMKHISEQSPLAGIGKLGTGDWLHLVTGLFL